MASHTIYCGNFDFVALAGTQWWALGMSGGNIDTEAGRPSLIHAAGVADRFGLHVVVNDRTSASTFTTTINGVAGAVSITIPAATTGFFEDLTHTDTIAAGNEYRGVLVAGTGGTDLRVANVSYRWTPDTVAGITLHAEATSFPAGIRYTSAAGSLGTEGGTEAAVQAPLTAGTLRRLQVQMRANDKSTAGTARIRINGVNGTGFATIPAQSTGLFEDATNTDTVTDGDLVSLEWNVPSGGTTFRTWRHQITHDATAAASAPSSWALGVTAPAGVSRYGPPGLTLSANPGHVLDSSAYRARARTAGRVATIRLWITANAATGAGALHLLVNQASVASVAIPAGQTGAITLTADTAFAADDDLGWQIAAGTGGNLTITSLAWTFAPVAGGTPVSQAISVPSEVLQSLALGTAVATESLTGVDRAVLVPWESLAAVQRGQASEAEVLQGVRGTTAAPAESLGGLRAASPVAHETLQHLLRSTSAAAESLASARREVAIAHEVLRHITRGTGVPAEVLARAVASHLAEMETLLRVARAIAVPFEAGSTATTTPVSQAVAVPMESLQGLRVARLIAVEALQGIAAGETSAAEALAAVRAGVSVPIELLGQLVVQHLAAAEILRGIGASRTAPSEWLQRVAAATVVPVAWLGPDAVSRILRDLDRSGHRFLDLDFSAHRLRDVDRSAPRLIDIDHSGGQA